MSHIRQVVSRGVGIWAILAETRPCAPYDAGVGRTGVTVAETPSLHGARLGVLHDHIDARRQAFEYVRRVGIAQIESHRALAATERDLPDHETRFALLRRGLYADDLRAEIGQHHGTTAT